MDILVEGPKSQISGDEELKVVYNPIISECVFEETNFLGGGLSKAEGGQGLPTASHEECSLECQQRSKCTHWEGSNGPSSCA